jgi:hypothetical protein
LFGTDAKLGLLPGGKYIDLGAENRIPKGIFGSEREEVVGYLILVYRKDFTAYKKKKR